ncbi:hypothetical protein U9R62_14975 [Cylindrospermopsis raciborskii DSH]|uniref:hypothetical protein n=1 Tax=Cylindrospermopsis raciborskii TaxID=77022 RepID=UPI002EDADBE1
MIYRIEQLCRTNSCAEREKLLKDKKDFSKNKKLNITNNENWQEQERFLKEQETQRAEREKLLKEQERFLKKQEQIKYQTLLSQLKAKGIDITALE